MFLRFLNTTTVKLNGSNYLLCDQLFRMHIGAKRKIRHLLKGQPNEKDPTYWGWIANNCFIITLLLNSIEDKVSSDMIFLDTDKEAWDTLKKVDNEKNISKEFKLYKCLFTVLIGYTSVSKYYSVLRVILDELDVH